MAILTAIVVAAAAASAVFRHGRNRLCHCSPPTQPLSPSFATVERPASKFLVAIPATEWEKNCYAGYDEFVCEAMGFLQAKLMDTRPCLALGMVALVGFSVLASTGQLLFHLMEMSREVLAASHLIT